jgi:hypothetical protein
MARAKKIDVEVEVSKVETATKMTEAELRQILTPFATWAWGSPEVGQAVIEKYFRQAKP